MPTTTSALAFQNYYSTTLSSGITSSDTTIPLNSLPTGSQGFLVIEPDSSTNREVIFYTSKTGSAVVCTSAVDGRGVDGSTAVSHSSGATVKMQVVANMFEALQDMSAMPAGQAGTTWTPTWTNLTIGNAVQASTYIQIGKIVVFKLDLTFGTTTSVSGAVTFTLPVTSVTYPSSIGLGWVNLGAAAGIFPSMMEWNTTTVAQLIVLGTAGTYLARTGTSSTVPGTWATGDKITGVGFYEAA